MLYVKYIGAFYYVDDVENVFIWNENNNKDLNLKNFAKLYYLRELRYGTQHRQNNFHSMAWYNVVHNIECNIRLWIYVLNR